MRLSLILPIYNERHELSANFDMIYRKLQKDFGRDFEIVIAEDGSSDGSRELAKELSKRKNVKLTFSEKKRGRGGAIKDAVKMAKGRVIGYMDIDLAVPLGYLDEAVKAVESGKKVVIGSRYASGSAAKRQIHRLIASKVYNSMLDAFFDLSVNDSQCGFKFWDGGYIRKEAPKIKDNHWFFDSEMIVRAEANGVKPYELPVKWKEGKSTKVRAKDVLYFTRAMFRLKGELDRQL